MKYLQILTLLLCSLLISCASSPEDEFKKADNKNSIELFTKFIAKYPEHELVAQAKTKLYILEFEDASKSGDIPKLEAFLAKYPEGDSAFRKSEGRKYL